MTKGGIGQIPIPGILPCRVFIDGTCRCSSTWHSVADSQTIVQEHSLLVIHLVFYLTSNTVPNFSKGCLGLQQLASELLCVALNTEFIVRYSISKVKAGRDGQVRFEC